MPASLAGQTMLMSGGSRGIGLAIAVRAAQDGANIALVAKTDQPDPRLPGTIHSAAQAIENAGGVALPIVGDIRDDEQVEAAVAQVVERFGGIDMVVNNASAITLATLGELSLKRYDLMMDINARGTFLLTSLALPQLLRSASPRVLTLSPPLNMDRRWLRDYAPYTASKYAMTMLTLGVAEHYRAQKVSANCLWPRTTIATAAINNLVGGAQVMAASRKPEIMADAAHWILTRQPGELNGECFIDEEVLRSAGITDLTPYLPQGVTEEQLQQDFFLPDL